MYQNYIFDLYGTLVDISTNENKPILWKKLAEFYGFCGASYHWKELKNTYEKLVKEELSKNTIYAYPEIDITHVFSALYTQKDITPSKELILHTAQFFRIESTNFVRLYPGSMGTLQKLKEKGANLYLLSNAQRVFTEYEMRYLGIYDLFDGVLISSDEGCMKPDSAFFERVLTRYHLDKSESIMVGNDRISDLSGAKNAGLACCYIHTASSSGTDAPKDADYVIMDGDSMKMQEILLSHVKSLT